MTLKSLVLSARWEFVSADPNRVKVFFLMLIRDLVEVRILEGWGAGIAGGPGRFGRAGSDNRAWDSTTAVLSSSRLISTHILNGLQENG